MKDIYSAKNVYVVESGDRYSVVIELPDGQRKLVSEYWYEGDQETALLAAKDQAQEMANSY